MDGELATGGHGEREELPKSTESESLTSTERERRRERDWDPRLVSSSTVGKVTGWAGAALRAAERAVDIRVSFPMVLDKQLANPQHPIRSDEIETDL